MGRYKKLKNRIITSKDLSDEAKKYLLKTGLLVICVTMFFLILNSTLISLEIHKALAWFLTLLPYAVINANIIKRSTKKYKHNLDILSRQMIEYHKKSTPSS